MKTFLEYLEESKSIPKFFAHFKSGAEGNHSLTEKVSIDTFDRKKVLGKDEVVSDEHPEYHHDIPVPPKVKDAVSRYTGHSKSINEYLHAGIRHPAPEESEHIMHMRNDIHHIDEFTNHKDNALKKPIKTYSGIGRDFGSMLKGVKVGEHVHSPAFVSTSTHHSIARNFMQGNADATHEYHPTEKDSLGRPKMTSVKVTQHMVVFHLPKGYTKARSVGNVTRHPLEHEVLIARDQKFQKIGHDVKKEFSKHPFADHQRIRETHYHHLTPVEE